MKLKRFYLLIFILAIVVLTGLSYYSIDQLNNTEGDFQQINYRFNLLSTLIGYFNFTFTTILLIISYFLVQRRKVISTMKYLVTGLPYLMFVIYTVITYRYIYGLYNVFQERTGQVIDTPDMTVLAVNISIFALTLGGINLVLLRLLGKE